VHADAGLLERVIANVVQNALRYAPADAPVRLAGSARPIGVTTRSIGEPSPDLQVVLRALRHAAATRGAASAPPAS
jgi:two-component system sensor histidine kinase KdpD